MRGEKAFLKIWLCPMASINDEHAPWTVLYTEEWPIASERSMPRGVLVIEPVTTLTVPEGLAEGQTFALKMEVVAHGGN